MKNTQSTSSPIAHTANAGSLDPLKAQIATAQGLFAQLLESVNSNGPITVDQYCRYISMQYHLTKDVQTYFFRIAANSALARRRKLRKFVCDFANEEELHYLVAGRDLLALGREPLPEPIDVTLWHSYFRDVVATRPFLRLGACAILENISDGVAAEPRRRAMSVPFLNKENTRFFLIHQHDETPHGDQVLSVLQESQLSETELNDVFLGARQATVMYMRMARWSIDVNDLSTNADMVLPQVSDVNKNVIGAVQMSQLNTKA